MEQGVSYITNVLSNFNDPDRDPLALVSTVAQNIDQMQVSTRADNQLTFDIDMLASGHVGVGVTVSDGTTTSAGVVYFSIKPMDTSAVVTDPVVKTTIPNTDTVIKLSSYMYGASLQPAQLTRMDTPNNASTTTSVVDISSTFKVINPSIYYVLYIITQGSISTTGLIRVKVQPAAGEAAKSVAANDIALPGADNTAIAELLANDVDPMDGVLPITTVNASANSGVKVGLVGHKRAYTTACQVLTKPVALAYTAASASGTAKSTIVLQPPTLAVSSSAPEAGNINAQMHAGGIVSVDVLGHVIYSDGTTVKFKNNL